MPSSMVSGYNQYVWLLLGYSCLCRGALTSPCNVKRNSFAANPTPARPKQKTKHGVQGKLFLAQKIKRD